MLLSKVAYIAFKVRIVLVHEFSNQTHDLGIVSTHYCLSYILVSYHFLFCHIKVKTNISTKYCFNIGWNEWNGIRNSFSLMHMWTAELVKLHHECFVETIVQQIDLAVLLVWTGLCSNTHNASASDQNRKTFVTQPCVWQTHNAMRNIISHILF